MTASTSVPRPEYPRPHLVRERWMNLNGLWQFAFDDEDRGVRDGWHTGRELPLRIVVPFSFEAPLSGIDDRSVHRVIWYRRLVDIPAEFLRQRLLLHIGACDYAATIWVNGRVAGAHRGGYTPSSCDIQDSARPGTNEIVIRVEDHPTWTQPRGKQIIGEKPEWIDYDRVTGIWQTVWLEPVPDVSIENVWSHFHLDGNRLVVEVETNRECSGEVHVTVTLDGIEAATACVPLQDRCEARSELSITDPHFWSVDDPTLYDITVALRTAGAVTDSVETYAGLREFQRSGRTVLLNGQPFYFRGVLDQGYFPGGWYTAPTDADLKRDIELMKALGFNGARKHQKVEDPRWLAWADRLGFVVWSEMGNGRAFGATHVADFTSEWIAAVRRDRMHPSIMAWVPLNESWGVDALERSAEQRAWVRALYHLTHALDGTRLVIGNDGWQFTAGDIWGIHTYVPEGAFLGQVLARVLAEPATEIVPGRRAALSGVDVAELPAMLTEFGGLACGDPQSHDGQTAWGYASVKDGDAFAHRIRELVDAVYAQPQFSGFVWTQLTDVQQEVNGLLHFDRTPKLPIEQYRGIFGRAL